MTANPDLADVIAQAADSGAKVILAGDTQQLQAVENGGGLSLLAGGLGFVQLAEPVRFRECWEQAASLRLRDGTPPCWPSTTSTPGSAAGSRRR